jgi:hypothetical protein
MNWRRFAFLAAVLALAGLVGAGVGRAQAANALHTLASTISSANKQQHTAITSSGCPVGLAAITAHHMSIVDGVATETFTVAASCEHVQVGLASYKAANTEPFPNNLPQTLSDSSDDYFDAGTHTMTMQVPDCFAQTDAFIGPVIEDLTRTNHYGPERVLDHQRTGTTACTTTSTTTVTVTTPGSTTTVTTPGSTTTVTTPGQTTTLTNTVTTTKTVTKTKVVKVKPPKKSVPTDTR